MNSTTVVPQPPMAFDFKPLVEALSLPINIAVKTAKNTPSLLYNSAKAIGKTAILDAPKAIVDNSTHALDKTRHFAAESIKPLAKFFNASNITPKILPAPTLDQQDNNLKQGQAITKQFTSTMASLKSLSNIKVRADDLEQLANTLKQHKATLENGEHTTLEDLFKADPQTDHQLDLRQIAHLLDEVLPLSAAPNTHNVHHSAAPSWLALLLDSTYEPSHIEELVAFAKTAANQGIEPIQEEFNETAQEYTEKPLEALAKDTTFKNVDSSIAYAIADVAASFLGILSVVRGYQEFKEAGHHLHSLKAEQKQLKTDKKHINTLHSMLGENIPSGLMFQKLLNLSKLDRNKRGIYTTKIDRWIGLSAVGAGASSALKGISDLGIKTGLAIKTLASGHGLFGGAIVATKGTAAGLAATATGIAGTLALGPLAGLFAVGLGLGFNKKTSTKLNQLKQDFKTANNDFEYIGKLSTISEPDKTSFSDYKKFIDQEGQKRTRFFSHFSKWNKAFLVGAGLYTASAGAKAAIVGASLLGATAAASNPVGWGVLTGVGIAGAIVVGLATLGFIKGHVRQTRYNQHTAGDHPLVDRHFLVNAQNFGRKGDTQAAHFHEGLKLAADNLEFLNQRQTSLKTLLETAATVTDSLAPHSDKLNVFQRMRGNTLGKTKFNAYLNKEGGLKTILDKFVTNDIEKHIQHIEHKLAFRQKTHEENILSDEQLALIAQQPNAQEALDSYESHLTRLTSKTKLDTHKLIQLQTTQAKIQELRGSDDEKLNENQQVIKTLLLQHWGVQTTDKKGKALDVDKLFAKQMVRTLNKEVDMAKGVLFEAQLEASHMNHHEANSTTSSQNGSSHSKVTTHNQGNTYSEVQTEDSDNISHTSPTSPEEEPSPDSRSSDGEIHTAPQSPVNA